MIACPGRLHSRDCKHGTPPPLRKQTRTLMRCMSFLHPKALLHLWQKSAQLLCSLAFSRRAVRCRWCTAPCPPRPSLPRRSAAPTGPRSGLDPFTAYSRSSSVVEPPQSKLARGPSNPKQKKVSTITSSSSSSSRAAEVTTHHRCTLPVPSPSPC